MGNPRFEHCETVLVHKFDKWLNKVTCGDNMARDVFGNISKLKRLLREAEKQVSLFNSDFQLEQLNSSMVMLADAVLRSNHIGATVIIDIVLQVRTNLHLCEIERQYSRTG